jgi:hypothetical protein
MTDLILDDNYDLFEDPVTLDWLEGISDIQHQQLLLMLPKGSIKENPTCTADLLQFVNNDDVSGLLTEVRAAFTGDGMVVNKLTLDPTTFNLTTDANYPN